MSLPHWRQGAGLPKEAMSAVLGNADEHQRVVVATHTCDLQRIEGEAVVVILGRAIDAPDPQRTYGKGPRALDLETQAGGWVRYEIDTLRTCDSAILLPHAPCPANSHDVASAAILAMWVAQRFDRMELPDSVHNALKYSGVEEALNKALSKSHPDLVDVRIGILPSMPVDIANIILVYRDDRPGAAEAAKQACKAVEARVEQEAVQAKLKGKLTFGGIEAVSDMVMPVAMLRTTQRWRSEHVSLAAEEPSERPPR